MGLRNSFFLVVALVFSVGPACGQTAQQIEWCEGKNGVSPDLAIGSCTALIQSGKFTQNSLAVIFYSRALAYRDRKDTTNELADLSQSISINPRYYHASYARAVHYFLKDDYAAAISDATNAISIQRTGPAFLVRARAYLLKDDLDKALADYEESLALQPKSSDAGYGRGRILHLKRRYAEARDQLSQVIEWSPKAENAYAERCSVLLDMKNYSEAIEDCSKAIELDPKSPRPFVLRSQARLELKRFSFALDDADKVIELAPRWPDGFHQKCLTFLRQERFAEGAVACDKALEINPKMSAALYNRGIIKILQGDIEAGNQDVASARNMNPALGLPSSETMNYSYKRNLRKLIYAGLAAFFASLGGFSWWILKSEMRRKRAGYILRFIFWFSGRMNRAEYAVTLIGALISVYAMSLVLGSLIGLAVSWSLIGSFDPRIFEFILLPVWLWILFSSHVKRFHDMGRSGWSVLLMIVPLVNLLVWLLLFFVKGTVTANKFGEPTAFFVAVASEIPSAAPA